MRFPFGFFHTGINDYNYSGIRAPRFLTRFLWSHPRLYSPYAKYRHGVDIFHRNGDMIVDGFPRSGNTYTVQMIDLTQGKKGMCISHAHCPPYLLGPLQSGFPVCLTLRQPEDSVISWSIMRKLPLDVVMGLYIDFHRVMLPHVTRLLVLNFTTITTDFGAVLQLINRRFGLNLNVPSNLEARADEAFAQIDRHYQAEPGGFDPSKVARPHPKRDEMKDAVRQELHTARHARLLAECRELYAAFDAEAQRALRDLAESEARR